MNNSNSNEDSLTAARSEINEIDRKIANLFERRMNAVRSIAEYKRDHGLPIFDEIREQEVINRNSALLENHELKPYFIDFLRETMEISKKYQRKLLIGLQVAYSGVPGAFAAVAVEKLFPNAAPVSCQDFKSAYESVVSGESDFAVLPIENSSNGDVTQVLDLAFEGPLSIVGIYEFKIIHCLVAPHGATIDSVKTVVSHPQALGQCKNYIYKHKFAVEEVGNTAVAAKNIAELGDISRGAIAGRETAELYHLDILDSHINESNDNTTRFAVFSRTSVAEETVTNADPNHRFILFFTVNNTAGSLGEAVKMFGKYGFNLCALKSRPTKLVSWEYYFIVEGDGDIRSEAGKKLLSELRSVCLDVRLIGNYKYLNNKY